MPRPKSPCGTYPAYRRHLKLHEPVDAACRRAQQEHDAARGRSVRQDDAGQGMSHNDASVVSARPVVTAVAPAVADRFVEERERLREMLRKCVADLDGFVSDGYLFGVVDLVGEMQELADEWCLEQAAIHDGRGEDAPDWLNEYVEKLKAAMPGAADEEHAAESPED